GTAALSGRKGKWCIARSNETGFTRGSFIRSIAPLFIPGPRDPKGRHTNMKKLVLAVLLLVGTAAYADNLSFIGPTANGEYGPYTMSLNGTATQMICFSGENWISASEGSWSVVAYTSTTVVGPVSGTAFAGSSAQYNELGYLANELFADPGDPNL